VIYSTVIQCSRHYTVSVCIEVYCMPLTNLKEANCSSVAFVAELEPPGL
jgi:hypothetical protein